METTVFLLSNALVRGDYSKAYALLDLLMAQREEPYTILAVLSSAYIDMYRVRAAIEAGETSMAPTEYGDYRGRDFRLKYAERDVRDLSIEMLRECLSLLLNCDLLPSSFRAVKTWTESHSKSFSPSFCTSRTAAAWPKGALYDPHERSPHRRGPV